MKFSLAIPTFNRPDLTMESFAKVLSNECIDEIVILDDCSTIENYSKLFESIIYDTGLDVRKIKIYRNSSNLGPLRNKYEVVKKCNNEYVILLDSDNIIDENYVKCFGQLHFFDKNVLYCPEKLMSLDGKVQWDYSEFCHLDIDHTNAKNYLDVGSFEACLNTGNYLVNRAMYLQVYESYDKDNLLSYNDAMYFSCLWLLYGNMIKIVPGLYYTHRLHSGSWYKQNNDKCKQATKILRNFINSF